MDSTDAGGRRRWWDVRLSRNGAFHKERRHLMFLSVLGGLVFFGAGMLGGTTRLSSSSKQEPQQASHSLSAVPQGGSPSSRQAQEGSNAAASTGMLAAIPNGDAPSELKVHLYNSYSQNNPIDLYPWQFLAEPFKPTTMELLDWPASGEQLEYR